MASVAPFKRSQWASQSLRVTAKELSIVSTRGKNTAIAERFSKYQMAAEEGSAERKKTVVEPLLSSLSGGNLSVLKKPPPQATAPAGSSLDQDTVQEVKSETRTHQFTTEAEDLMEMEPCRDLEVEEGAAAEVSDIEKPSVPINSLKMMFERGETPDKVFSRRPPFLLRSPVSSPLHSVSPHTSCSSTILLSLITPSLCSPLHFRFNNLHPSVTPQHPSSLLLMFPPTFAQPHPPLTAPPDAPAPHGLFHPVGPSSSPKTASVADPTPHLLSEPQSASSRC
uniref:Uncharacterized protein n=1 Tax=Cyprinodon variegatus TaxID=28743 RepID=A0A3Q2CST7_CYPVA